ncbi:MAG: AsmA-like C-terminal region-containing protein [Pseudomonadota bacterium]
MIRFFVFVGGLLVLLLIGALVAPPFIDWDQYRDRFEAEAERLVGMPVKVGGSTSVTLLPLPSVTFEDISVGGQNGVAPPLTADRFKINVELAPVLKGDIVIANMEADRPQIRLRIGPDGRVMWPERTGGGEGGLDIDRDDVALENITIRDGGFRIEDLRFNRSYQLGNIDATASAVALAGPWRAQGTADYDGEAVRWNGSTGRWRADDTVRLGLRVEPQSLPFDFDFEGPLALAQGAPSLTGLVRITPTGEPNDADRIAFPRPSSSDYSPVTFEGDFTLSSGGSSLPAFELKLGGGEDPYTVTGNAQALFGERLSFVVNAEGQQINLQRLEGETGEDATAKPKAGLVDRIAQLEALIGQVPQFSADGSINIFLPAIVAGDTVVRDVGMDLKPLAEGNGWTVRNLEAELPGRTELRADGELRLEGGMAYSGQLLVATKQPTGLATWLGADVTQALRDTGSAGVSGQMEISRTGIVGDDLEIVIDQDQLTGALKLTGMNSENEAVFLSLKGSNANLDKLAALSNLLTGRKQPVGQNTKSMRLELEVEAAQYDDVKARFVDMAVDVTEQALQIERLALGDISGAAISMSGTVRQGLSTDGQQTAEQALQGRIVSADPTRFLNLLNSRLGPFNGLGRFLTEPDLSADTELDFQINAGAKTGSSLVKAQGQLGGSEVDFTADGVAVPGLSANGGDGAAAKHSFKLVAVNENASQLLLQLGVPVLPVDAGSRTAFRINAEGSPKDGYRGEGALTMRDGFISAGGFVRPDFKDGLFTGEVDLNLVADSNDIDTAILMSGISIPGFGEGLSARFKSKMVGQERSYAFNDIEASLAGVKYSGDVTLNSAARPRPRVEGTLQISQLDTDMVFDLVHGVSLSGDASAPGNATFAGLDGRIDLSAAAVNGPFALTQRGADYQFGSATTSLTINDGDMNFDDIDVEWLGGRLSGSLATGRANQSRTASGRLQLQGAQAGLIAGLAGYDGVVDASANATLSFESTARDERTLVGGMTGGGLIELGSGSIDGLNAQAFASVIGAADGIDDEDVVSAAPRIVDDAVFHRRFPFEAVDIPFAISLGTVRVNSVTLNHPLATMRVDGELSLTGEDNQLQARIAYDPQKEEVAGAQPEVSFTLAGAPGAMTRETDTSFFETFLGLRLSERREREFRAQQASILERQRLNRAVRIYQLKEQARQFALEEQRRIEELRREQEERQRQEELRRQAEEREQARIKAELEEAEKRAAREAAIEAGRREQRAREIEELRRKADDAARRLQRGRDLRLEFDPDLNLVLPGQ